MLKKSFVFALFAALLLLFSACIEVVEEIWLSEDGSGRWSATVDFSALLRDSVFSKRLEREVDSLRQMGGPMVVDSTFFVFEKWPDSLRRRMPAPHLLKEIEGHVHLDLAEKKLWKRVEFSFDSPRDFEQKMRVWRTASQLLRPSPEGFGEPFFGATAPKIALEGREARFFFDFSTTGNEAVARFLASKKDDPLLDGFLRSARHRVVLHLPKKAKKWRGAGFSKTGETTFESRRTWLEMIEGEPLRLRTRLRR